MTDEKIIKVLDACAYNLRTFEVEVTPRRIDPCVYPEDRVDQFSHALWMIGETKKLLAEGRREKAMRWLGFIQGVLWSSGLISLKELKELNRPDELDAKD